MLILSHRGLWTSPVEKNTVEAFERALKLGFGIETDVRDCAGSLVVSHDPPAENILSFQEFLILYKQYGDRQPLALNIKADGLQELLTRELERFQVTNYFVFDMSVPDTLGYAASSLRFFTRQSEYENIPVCYEQSHGVWVDCFHSEWMTVDLLTAHLNAGKQVCLVSPELHRRTYQAFWQFLKSEGLAQTDQVMLCTDHPNEARNFFHGPD